MEPRPSMYIQYPSASKSSWDFCLDSLKLFVPSSSSLIEATFIPFHSFSLTERILILNVGSKCEHDNTSCFKDNQQCCASLEALRAHNLLHRYYDSGTVRTTLLMYSIIGHTWYSENNAKLSHCPGLYIPGYYNTGHILTVIVLSVDWV